ncbi:hypothetical protein F5X68DRAFT_237240 [Plectosphaerella plurivora]|uniref:Uncharacterized protein n=1 Tax=Plectosphaerella plurivora TaxID=936078 RepID=A0A9P9A3U6_9PEZI|nr:hypothetical protein F5X68DRAFT_237240 [Plectosphaerella plurivora]
MTDPRTTGHAAGQPSPTVEDEFDSDGYYQALEDAEVQTYEDFIQTSGGRHGNPDVSVLDIDSPINPPEAEAQQPPKLRRLAQASSAKSPPQTNSKHGSSADGQPRSKDVSSPLQRPFQEDSADIPAYLKDMQSIGTRAHIRLRMGIQSPFVHICSERDSFYQLRLAKYPWTIATRGARASGADVRMAANHSPASGGESPTEVPGTGHDATSSIYSEHSESQLLGAQAADSSGTARTSNRGIRLSTGLFIKRCVSKTTQAINKAAKRSKPSPAATDRFRGDSSSGTLGSPTSTTNTLESSSHCEICAQTLSSWSESSVDSGTHGVRQKIRSTITSLFHPTTVEENSASPRPKQPFRIRGYSMMGAGKPLPPSKIPTFDWSKTNIPSNEYPIRNQRFLRLHRVDVLSPRHPGAPHCLLASPPCQTAQKDPVGPQEAIKSSIFVIQGTEEDHVEFTAESSTRNISNIVRTPCKVIRSTKSDKMSAVVARQPKTSEEEDRAKVNRDWRILPDGLYHAAITGPCESTTVGEIIKKHRKAPGGLGSKNKGKEPVTSVDKGKGLDLRPYDKNKSLPVAPESIRADSPTLPPGDHPVISTPKRPSPTGRKSSLSFNEGTTSRATPDVKARVKNRAQSPHPDTSASGGPKPTARKSWVAKSAPIAKGFARGFSGPLKKIGNAFARGRARMSTLEQRPEANSSTVAIAGTPNQYSVSSVEEIIQPSQSRWSSDSSDRVQPPAWYRRLSMRKRE